MPIPVPSLNLMILPLYDKIPSINNRKMRSLFKKSGIPDFHIRYA